jgi:hypothetical protein
MITLTAKINVLEGKDDDLSYLTCNIANSVNSDTINEVLNNRVGNFKYVGSLNSDSSGVFPKPYEINVYKPNRSRVKNLILSFDNEKNEYPQSLKLSGIELKETTTTTQDTTNLTVGYWQVVGTDENGQDVVAVYFNEDISDIGEGDILNFLNEYVSNNGNIDIPSEYTKFTFFNLYEGESDSDYEALFSHINRVGDNDFFFVDEENTQKVVFYFATDFSEEGIEDFVYNRLNISIEVTTTVTNTQEIKVKIAEYSLGKPFIIMNNLPNYKRYVIQISKWSKPNSPLSLSGLYTGISIDVDRRNIISISRSIHDRSDFKLPSFGIISNTASIEFNDSNGEILNYIEELILTSGSTVEILLNNTLSNSSERIATMETDQWNYDNDNRVVSVSIKDDLEKWQDINVDPIDYDPRVVKSKSFMWLYRYLWGITTANGNYNMLSIEELDSDTQAVLNNTYTQYPLLESGSLWRQWTKLCQVCQLHIYKNNNGVIVCRYNGGN